MSDVVVSVALSQPSALNEGQDILVYSPSLVNPERSKEMPHKEAWCISWEMFCVERPVIE